MESYSEGEEEESISMLRRLPSCGNVPDDTTAPVAAVEIRSLIERKEELERRQRKQDRHRQRVQVSAKYPRGDTSPPGDDDLLIGRRDKRRRAARCYLLRAVTSRFPRLKLRSR